MPQEQTKLNAGQPIVELDGTMAQAFRTWALKLSNAVPIVGTGNPEGVLEAPQYTLFIDETAPTAPVQYRKMIPEIGGDRSQGWIVV